MQKVLTAEQMRQVDRLTTERYGIPSIILMENAAHGVARVITEKLGGSVKGKSVLILCGKGNNGGDGAALARILHMDGANVIVDLFGRISETSGDARTNFLILDGLAKATSRGFFREQDIEGVDAFDDWLAKSNFDFADVVVDALFGTGLSREIDGSYGELAGLLGNWCRSYEKPLFISIDMPSGLSADAGEPLGLNLQADTTVTFTAPKSGNVVSPASSFNGKLVVADIGTPKKLIDEQPSQLYLAEHQDVLDWLKKTAYSTGDYKNKRGHALIIAGSESYSGAAVLAGNAAIRSGVGLATLAVPAAIRSEVAARSLPDLIVRPFDDGGFDFSADSTLIGCGLDANISANEAMYRKVVEERTTPVIVDAGALWFVADGNASVNERADMELPGKLVNRRVSALILTPHEGEFLRLLGTADKDLIKDRVAAVRDFAVKNNVILVLKGERVLIGSPDGRVVVNPTGNSGLGKAGNGDTLAGILAGFVAQAVKFEIDIFETVVAAVYIAGMAADIAKEEYGKRVMTASDVRKCLVGAFAAVGEVK